MTNVVISVEHLIKKYDLGVIGTGMLGRDLNRWWARLRHLPDPEVKLGNEHLQKTNSGSVLALDNVTFTVKQGETLGIIGRNGAGKSTLLKILSRVTAPTSGKAKVKGRIGSLLEVGTGFHPELTGRENVFLNGAILGMKKAEVARKFEEIIDFSGVERYIDTPVKRYSSGMYVRLAFAVAAHLDPEILIVDEVLAVGDAEFQRKCIGKMGKVASEGRTVLFVSHNMAAIENICNRCLYLSAGTIDDVGPTPDVVNKYLSTTYTRKRTTDSSKSIIKQVDVLNQEGTIISHIRAGEPIKIRITVDVINKTIENPVIGIGINNALGIRVFTVGTYYSATTIGKLHGKKFIECSIINNLLIPGKYFVKIALGNNSYENFEEIENSVEFNVEASDYYGTGKLPSINQGFFLVKSDWVINEDQIMG